MTIAILRLGLKRQVCLAEPWKPAQLVTGENPTATVSPNPKTTMRLIPFRTTDFCETLSIDDLLFDKFCVIVKPFSQVYIQRLCQKCFLQ